MEVSHDRLYFTDVSNRRVRAVDLATGMITTIAGGGTDNGDGGPATEAALSTHPMRVMVKDGDLYISDSLHQRVRRVDAATGTISTYGGNGTESFSGDDGPATAAGLAEPHGTRCDGEGSSSLIPATTASVESTGAWARSRPSPARGMPAAEADLSFPLAVALDADDNLYIVDTDNNRIRRVDAATGHISTVVGVGEIGSLEDRVDVRQARFGRLRDSRREFLGAWLYLVLPDFEFFLIWVA